MSKEPKIPRGWHKLRKNAVIKDGDNFWQPTVKAFLDVWKSRGFTPADGIQDGPYIRKSRRSSRLVGGRQND